MMHPFFSICIPTRNRTETLISCLNTLLNQNFENYEIIISDNSDLEFANNNKKNIDNLGSDKIFYYKTERTLSMTENFEYGLLKCKGTYIMFLGDDDAMVTNSLLSVYEAIQKTGSKAVTCRRPFYYWINSLDFPNSILTYPKGTTQIEVYTKSVLKQVANFKINYFELPMIYYGFIHKDVITEIIQRQGSFFENTASVDMYSGFCVSWVLDKFLVTELPFSIAGISAKSNGSYQINNKKNKEIKEFNETQSLDFYYSKYKIPNNKDKFQLSTFVWSELCKFKENFKISDEELFIDYSKFAIHDLNPNSIWENLGSELKEDKVVQALLNTDKKYTWLRDFLDKYYFNKRVFNTNFNINHLEINNNHAIDPTLFGIENIYDAALFIEKLNKSQLDNIPIPITKSIQEVPQIEIKTHKKLKNKFKNLIIRAVNKL